MANSSKELQTSKAFDLLPADTPDPEETNTPTPWLGFWDHRSSSASDVRAAVPGISAGQPYLGADGQFADASAMVFMLLESHLFLAKRNNSGEIIETAPMGPEVDGFKENAVVRLLAIDGQKVSCVVAGLRPTKVRMVKDLQRAIKATDDPDWAGDDKVRQAAEDTLELGEA